MITDASSELFMKVASVWGCSVKEILLTFKFIGAPRETDAPAERKRHKMDRACILEVR